MEVIFPCHLLFYDLCLLSFLQVPALYGIDTRMLSKIIRDKV